MITNGSPAALSTNAPALAEGLRDIVGPVRIIPLWQWIAAALLALLLLGAAAALFVWWRARQRRRLQPPPAPPPAPAHVRASRDLELALQHLDDPDLFCTEMSRILRRYIEERFGWNAPDRTTEEFLLQLSTQRTPGEALPESLRHSLAGFLTGCDRVKFARHDPTESELRDLHRMACLWVADTVPPPAPAGLPAETPAGAVPP